MFSNASITLTAQRWNFWLPLAARASVAGHLHQVFERFRFVVQGFESAKCSQRLRFPLIFSFHSMLSLPEFAGVQEIGEALMEKATVSRLALPERPRS